MMEETRNPYQILNASENATEEVVKKLYWQLAAENHPDKNPGDPDASNRMKDINWAWSVLSDPEERKKIDESLARAREQARARAATSAPSPTPSYAHTRAATGKGESETPWGAILAGLGFAAIFAGLAAATSRSPAPSRARTKWDPSVQRYRSTDGRFTNG